MLGGGICSTGLGGYVIIPEMEDGTAWVGEQQLESSGPGEIIFATNYGVHEIPYYAGFEIFNPEDDEVYRCYWDYPNGYVDVWIEATGDPVGPTRELHMQINGGTVHDGGEVGGGITCDRITVQACRYEYGAIVGAIAHGDFGSTAHDWMSYVSPQLLNFTQWSEPSHTGVSVPVASIIKMFVARHTANNPDCASCRSCDSEACSPGNRPNDTIRLTIPSGVIPGYAGAANFPTQIDLQAAYGQYLGGEGMVLDDCMWHALVLDLWKCSSIACPTTGNALNGLYLVNAWWKPSIFGGGLAAVKCGSVVNVWVEDDHYVPPGWGYWPFVWDGIGLLVRAYLGIGSMPGDGAWSVEFLLVAQSSVDLPTEMGDVPFVLGTGYGNGNDDDIFCFAYPSYTYYRARGYVKYAAQFTKDATSGCIESIVLTKLEGPAIVEPEGVYEGTWPDTITLNPNP